MLIETATLKAHYCHLPKNTHIIINDMDNIIDLIPEGVVRCKDCRFCTTNTSVMTTQTMVHCNAWRVMTDWDGYCYKGERRCRD